MARPDQRKGEQLSSALLSRRISVTGRLFILILVRGLLRASSEIGFRKPVEFRWKRKLTREFMT